jgi:hypothetical protein
MAVVPNDHHFGIRYYMREPDGYIIEVGQSNDVNESEDNYSAS